MISLRSFFLCLWYSTYCVSAAEFSQLFIVWNVFSFFFLLLKNIFFWEEFKFTSYFLSFPLRCYSIIGWIPLFSLRSQLQFKEMSFSSCYFQHILFCLYFFFSSVIVIDLGMFFFFVFFCLRFIAPLKPMVWYLWLVSENFYLVSLQILPQSHSFSTLNFLLCPICLLFLSSFLCSTFDNFFWSIPS